MINNLQLLDPAVMGNEESMYGLFENLRESEPVTFVDHPDYGPFWALTKHEDIKFVSQNNARFLNNPRTVLVQEAAEKMLLEKFTEL